MPNKKISGLPAATVPLSGAELFEIVQGGINKQVAKSDVSTGGGGTAATTTFTPAGSISATNVQDAIEEMDTEFTAALAVNGIGNLLYMYNNFI